LQTSSAAEILEGKSKQAKGRMKELGWWARNRDFRDDHQSSKRQITSAFFLLPSAFPRFSSLAD
jgi:hypothetical protein